MGCGTTPLNREEDEEDDDVGGREVTAGRAAVGIRPAPDSVVAVEAAEEYWVAVELRISVSTPMA